MGRGKLMFKVGVLWLKLFVRSEMIDRVQITNNMLAVNGMARIGSFIPKYGYVKLLNAPVSINNDMLSAIVSRRVLISPRLNILSALNVRAPGRMNIIKIESGICTIRISMPIVANRTTPTNDDDAVRTGRKSRFLGHSFMRNGLSNLIGISY